jgi:DNA repair photolyase
MGTGRPNTTFPLFVDLGRPAPSTRDVANAVKLGGVAALTDADRRADQARYLEVVCRSALNRVRGMPFNWTLNPYRGCTHGCHYCFARRYHVQFEMNADDEFASLILVKRNFVDVLRHELDRPSWARELVAVGTATDPYQPIEGHYKLTRSALAALAKGRTSVGLVTKGPMVVRDRDVLIDLTRAASCSVCMSVPTVDEETWRILEPGTAHPLQRLRAVRELVDAGVNAGVLMAPIVPGFTSSQKKLERTIKAVADHGARFLGCNVMHLEDGTRRHFMNFLKSEFPSMVPRYERLYVKKYAPDGYRRQIQGLVRVLQERYSLNDRENSEGKRSGLEAPDLAHEEPEQVGFVW